MTRPLSVLHLVANRWWTGSADPVIQLVGGLRARGHRVELGVIPGDRFEAKARAAGITPVPGLSLEARFDPVGLARDVARVRRLVREATVDVVHVHHSHDHWLGALCRGGAALVRTFHNQRSVRLGWASRALYRRTDAVVAVSAPIEARCRRAGVAATRLSRVGGVVAVDRFASDGGAADVRREVGAGDGPVIGCVARLAHDRGHAALIRGFQQFLRVAPGGRLLLVGKGEAREHLEDLVTSLGLSGRAIFTGYRDADLPAILHALDVFVLMGAGSDETCRAALEAMAAGRPVIARRVGALPDAVEDGVTGLLLPDDRPETLAGALAAVLADPARARSMGAAGRARARRDFSPERHAADVEAIYLGALGHSAAEAAEQADTTPASRRDA